MKRLYKAIEHSKGILVIMLVITLTSCSHSNNIIIIPTQELNQQPSKVQVITLEEIVDQAVNLVNEKKDTPTVDRMKQTTQTEEQLVITSTPPKVSATEMMQELPTATAIGCQENHGNIEIFAINSDLVSYEVTGRIYLPPCYDPNRENGYPVIYLLHGQSYNDDQWDRLGVDDISDMLINNGYRQPFLIVMPFEKYYLEEPNQSNFDVALIDVILPWVDQTYRTCAEAKCRAIGGISRGAAWAMRLGLIHWDLFSAIGAHSFPPFGGDVYNLPYWFQDIPLDNRPRILIDIGRFDPYIKAAAKFEDWMTEYRIPHEWRINEGTHNEEYWSDHIEDYIRWYTEPWK